MPNMGEGVGIILILCLCLLVASPSSSSSFSCHPDQRDTLLRFIHSFSITPSSSRYCRYATYPLGVASWREDKDCCSWDGITCDTSTGDVIGLDLSCAGLLGSIHSGSPLFSLCRLRTLSLAHNDLLGSTLPQDIGALARLEYLDLSYSNVSGILPMEISQLSKLSSLSLSGNFGLDANHSFSLPKLERLSMENCNLSEFPSFLSRSEGLRHLSLSGNKIQEIPAWFWSIRIDSLKVLSLDDNNIGGSIPTSICRLTSLSFINLRQNNLAGVIPPCIGNLTGLELLYLGQNSLSGPLPRSLTNIMSLRQLNVSYNNFVDQLPIDIFSQSAWLGYIDLSENKFEGQLPGPSAMTKYYWASNNHFSGEISLVCNAPTLMGLDLSNNSLTGTFPDCLSTSMDLLYLNLRENKFHGQISENFHEGSKLMSLDLSRNQFEGTLPRSLSNCKNLELLNVGGNKITDSFPDWLGNLPLKVLSLRSNNFHGRVIISNETRNFSRVRILDLSNNCFEGNIMDNFIAGLFGVTSYEYSSQYLGSHNSVWEYYSVMIDLKGVETEMVQINLQYAMLDLSNNHFQGQIPKNIGLLKSLKSLNFSHNRFMGMIPPSLGNLTYLESLDLSSNHLTGDIPNELGKLTFLGVLNLSWNNLTGPIPTGGHFNTFSDSSFQGNLGLCGKPLTITCRPGNEGARPPPEGKDDGGEEGGGWWLGWKCVVLGFGAGVGMGISLGYTVLEMGRPHWLVRVVNRVEVTYRKASKRKGGGAWRYV